jgi:oxygen-independent coproporphyrinogen-3 oxidase
MFKELAINYNEKKMPLYVSYPTTSWWKDTVKEDNYINSFNYSKINYLYFHFPYCKKPCYYCCCYKEVLKSRKDNDLYIDYLEKEMKLKFDSIKSINLSDIKKIHWGGGTPSLLTIEQIDRVFKKMNEYIDLKNKEIEISIEAYPERKVLTKEKLKFIKDIGFTDISLGVQDFDEKIQKTINRDCNFEEVRSIIEDCKKINLKVHIDLCYGLPYQGEIEFLSTLKKVININPERISVFPYVHFPLVFPMQRLIPKESLTKSEEMIFLMKLADETLTDNGYKKIGYDHYCKKDDLLFENYNKKDLNRDFMGQSLLNNRNFMGFGVSAISRASDYMFHNLISLNKYYKFLNDNKNPINLNISHKISKDDILREYIILKCILTDFEIDKQRISNKFQIVFDRYFNEELKILNTYENDGLIKLDEIIKITDLGKFFARHIAHVFDKYYK